MIYIQLFLQFAKIGLFCVGGGMAAVPFLQDLAVTTGWYDTGFVTEMIAISESTPGPIGINMATYVGYSMGGILGSIVASFAMALPCLLISLLIAKSLTVFSENRYVKAVFYGIRPAVIALIIYAAYAVINAAFLHAELIGTAPFDKVIEIPKLIYFLIVFAAYMLLKEKKWAHPVIFIAISAVVGIVCKF